MTRVEAALSAVVAALSLVVVLTFAEGSGPRVAAALLLLLVLPGYVLVGLLVPEMAKLETWMRVFVSVAFSLVTTGLLGLGFALFAVPSSTPSVPVAAALITVVVATVSQVRGVAPPKRPGFRTYVQSLPVVALLLALALGVLIGRVMSPTRVPEPFTTFSVVGPDGTVESLPDESCAASTLVTLQIRSHESKVKTFEIWQSSVVGRRLVYGPVSLEPGEDRDLRVEVGASAPAGAPVEFELRTPGQGTPYRSVRLCGGQR